MSGPGGAFDLLIAELDRWAAMGRQATLWWRDDDAVEATPQLDRLLALCGADVPLLLAAIPARVEASLIVRLRRALPGVAVAVHGIAHENLAAPDAKKSELSGDPDRLLPKLADARTAIAAAFDRRATPILVPPWNRIAAPLAARVGEAGFRAVSAFNPAKAAELAPGVAALNTHVDIVDWRGAATGTPRSFIGAAAMARHLVTHLSARRTGYLPTDEPTGLLTHHLDHDSDAFDALAALVGVVRAHPAAHWVDVRDAAVLR